MADQRQSLPLTPSRFRSVMPGTWEHSPFRTRIFCSAPGSASSDWAGWAARWLEILARLGIGNLTLVDGDVFEESNLNRQLLSTPQTLGASKTATAANRVRQINPSVQTCMHDVFLDAENADRIIAGADVVVDCLDNLKTRFVLEKAARAAKIPLVSAAIAGTYGQITTIFPEDPGLSLIYGPEDQVPAKGAETTLGTLPYTAMMMASLECSEITKIFLNAGSLLRNKLLVMDLMDNAMEVLSLDC